MTPIATIKEHMQVHGSDGILVGVVDHVEGESTIKLTKTDSVDGQHHFIDAGLIERVDAYVHLSKPADEVMSEWGSEDDEVDLEDDDAGLTDVEQSSEERQKEWTERRR